MSRTAYLPYNRPLTRLVPLAAALALSLTACSGDGDGSTADAGLSDSDTEDTQTVQRGELELDLIENPANALSFYISWSTDEPAATALDLDCDEGGYEAQFADEAERTDHEVFVMGLYDGARCTATATASYGEGDEQTGEVSFSVGPLPDFLPDLSPAVAEADKIQPGWTLFNLNNIFDDTPLTLAMIDAQGRYRWYHQVATSDTGADSDVRTTDEGVLLGGNRGRSLPQMIDWTGDVVWKLDYSTHHAIRLFGDDQVMFLDGTQDCPSGIAALVIRWHDFSEDKIVRNWSLCEHFEPAEPKPDWSHINSLELMEDDTAVILSSRTQNSLFKVNLETEEIEWMMGELGDFDIAPDDQFYRQHAPEVQPNGNILLFDNGNWNDRKYSRAIEIAYDVDAGTAEVVWEYTPEPHIFTPIWGDADRLANGNTLMTYGERSIEKTSHLIEVTQSGEKVWEIIAPDKWGWYRSERVVSPPNGRVID